MYLGSCAYLRFCVLFVFGLVYVVVVCCLGLWVACFCGFGLDGACLVVFLLG